MRAPTGPAAAPAWSVSRCACRHLADLGVVAGQQDLGDLAALRTSAVACTADARGARPRNSLRPGSPASPRTPGTSRTQASIATSAAASPPARTASPTATSSNPRASMHPLVHPFEPAAEHDQPGPFGPLSHARLGQGPAPGAHVQKRPPAPLHAVQRRGDHVRPHHLSRTATRGGVVEEAALIFGKAANVHCFQAPTAPARARPSRSARRPAGPGKASGNMVRTVASNGMARS